MIYASLTLAEVSKDPVGWVARFSNKQSSWTAKFMGKPATNANCFTVPITEADVATLRVGGEYIVSIEPR